MSFPFGCGDSCRPDGVLAAEVDLAALVRDHQRGFERLAVGRQVNEPGEVGAVQAAARGPR